MPSYSRGLLDPPLTPPDSPVNLDQLRCTFMHLFSWINKFLIRMYSSFAVSLWLVVNESPEAIADSIADEQRESAAEDCPGSCVCMPKRYSSKSSPDASRAPLSPNSKQPSRQASITESFSGSVLVEPSQPAVVDLQPAETFDTPLVASDSATSLRLSCPICERIIRTRTSK